MTEISVLLLKGDGHTETGVINEAALTSSKCWLDAVKAFMTHTTINLLLLVMHDEYYSSKEVQVPKTCLCIIKTKRQEEKKVFPWAYCTFQNHTGGDKILRCSVVVFCVCVFVFYHTLNAVFCFVFILAMKSAFTSILWCRLNCTGEGITQY